MTTKSPAKKGSAVVDENTKWFQRGFTSKEHYQGFLHFNDLIDEGYGFDDVYHDDYTGKTIRVTASDIKATELESEADKFLEMHDKP